MQTGEQNTPSITYKKNEVAITERLDNYFIENSNKINIPQVIKDIMERRGVKVDLDGLIKKEVSNCVSSKTLIKEIPPELFAENSLYHRAQNPWQLKTHSKLGVNKILELRDYYVKNTNYSRSTGVELCNVFDCEESSPWTDDNDSIDLCCTPIHSIILGATALEFLEHHGL